MNLLNAPQQGIMYALYTDRVEYKKYNLQELSEESLAENLLELHLFNETEEYRYVKTRRGEMETRISDEAVPYEDCYTERIFDWDKGKVEVVNYITYDENDLMRIDNYRLKEVK